MNKHSIALLSCLWCAAALLPAQTRPLPPAVRSIKVQVKDYKGGPVQDATVQLVAVQKGAMNHRRVPGQDPRALTAKDFVDGVVRLEELPDGEFVLMAENPLFAKSLSQPFTLPANEEALVAVTLSRGAVIEGRVVGPDQKPVVGAVVRSENGDQARAGALATMLASVLADTLTTTSATTGADGRFRLERLAQGKYRLVVDHPEFVRAETDAEVAGDATLKLPVVQLAGGVLITGKVERQGQPVSGAEVTFQFEDATKVKDPMQALRVKTYKTKTDDKGEYRLPSRVPAGKGYVLMAAEPGPPLGQAPQLAASRRVFDLAPNGSREHLELLVLPPQ